MKTFFFTLTLAAVVTAEFASFKSAPAPQSESGSQHLAKHRRDAGDDESKEEDFKVAAR